ncbi:MAG: prepilin-type N-terminal cleavage/methylation domain-containing protein [Coriobacteriales bacterium]|nr:prepilin-type N-terminal cleavage/methylation domain-containing protein [Coriobacteriales bacterium]
MQTVLHRQQQLKKNRRKGFTLVELIVVVVILAILAAIAVPSLIGYIDKSSEAAAKSEAVTVTTALQTASTDVYASTGSVATAASDYKMTTGAAAATWEDVVNDLAGTSYANGVLSGVLFSTNGTLTDYVFIASSGQRVTYASGVYTVS